MSEFLIKNNQKIPIEIILKDYNLKSQASIITCPELELNL